MSSFEMFVNRELPRRRPLLTVAITGYDADPNDGSAPSDLQSAPVGSWYLRETPEVQMYEKLTAGTDTWTVAGAETSITTLEDFTIPVDFNAAGAVDPPADIAFATQSEVDDFLTSNGTTAVRHLEAAWDSLAPIVLHTVTLELPQTGGIQRFRTGSGRFEGKTALGTALIHIKGAPSTTYTDIHTAATITALQVSNEVDGGSRNPWVEIGSTPYAAGGLKGFFAIFSNGLVALINDNTTDRLFITSPLSPLPSVGSDTVRVASPSSIYRNSLDDSSRVRDGFIWTIADHGNSLRSVEITDLSIEGFGPSIAHLELEGFTRLENILVDHDTNLAGSPRGRGLQFDLPSIQTTATYLNFAVRAGPGNRGSSGNGVAPKSPDAAQ